ncbi:hypothetical protein Hypma_001200 [Hypsizygus marmoreus]|uniref:Uncharacterized protein n=1 Tax=Hypsizygus marmoreus TaxID=39966 RepID=A0A369JAQ0_HYPMA|nr:hypothetical protein Hypma_001200 [Hypsizygus marmoreus]
MFSTSPNASTSSLLPKKSSSKDYESAFATLSSSFGFSGGAPALPRKAKTHSTPSASSTSFTTPRSPPTQQKNYEAAFGSLSSAYGFNGRAPSLPSKKGFTSGQWVGHVGAAFILQDTYNTEETPFTYQFDYLMPCWKTFEASKPT